MPRSPRTFFDGAIFHVYNRLARGERLFADEELAAWFVDQLRELTRRDGLTVYAWALLPGHYHLAVRMGAVPLARTFKTLQWRVSRRVNQAAGTSGTVWSGRYRARLVADQRYLDRLLVYIHLDPVTAGLASDPAGYRWSGHRELFGLEPDPLVDRDEVLRLFGETPEEARARYLAALEEFREESWIGEEPGRLPWWRRGRPGKSPAAGATGAPGTEGRPPRKRPRLEPEEYLDRAAAALGLEREELAGRGRSPELVLGRELLAVLGVERYGQRVRRLAPLLDRREVTVTAWIMRGTRRRVNDPEFARRLETLDRALSDG